MSSLLVTLTIGAGVVIVAGWLLAPAIVTALVLALVIVKVIVVAAAAGVAGMLVWGFADCIPVPSGLVRRTARVPGVVAGRCRVIARGSSGFVRRRRAIAPQSRLALPQPSPVRALTVAELAAHRAAEGVR